MNARKARELSERKVVEKIIKAGLLIRKRINSSLYFKTKERWEKPRKKWRSYMAL